VVLYPRATSQVHGAVSVVLHIISINFDDRTGTRKLYDCAWCFHQRVKQ